MFLVQESTNQKSKFIQKSEASWQEICTVPLFYLKLQVLDLMKIPPTLKSNPKIQCGLFPNLHDKICTKAMKSVLASMILTKTTKKSLLHLQLTTSEVTKEFPTSNLNHQVLEPTINHL